MMRNTTKDKNFRKPKFYLLPLTSYLFFKKKAQVMLEFAFCMIILFLMMYGIIMIFRWVGLDLGQRQQTHEAVLTADINPSYGQCTIMFWGVCVPLSPRIPVESGPLSQIDPYFYTPTSMNAVWEGN